jgi:hypothetical protein
VSCYSQFLSRSFASVQSIRNYLNGVKLLHLFQDHPFPHIGSFNLKLLLRGIATRNPHTPRQALPISPTILTQLHAILDLSLPLHATLWSSFLIGFFLFARKSNLVPPSQPTFNKHKHLCRGDILVCTLGLLVHIKWSKTIPRKQRYLLIPLTSIPNSPLCPLQAFLHMTNLVPARSHRPAFLVPSGSKLITLTHTSFTSHLRSLLHTLGFNPAAYSGHSFRRGGATWAFQSGVPGELIQLHRDWSSDSYLRYLDFSLQAKWGVSCTMTNALQVT